MALFHHRQLQRWWVPTGTPSGLPASANGSAGDVVASGWYAGWLGATQPPSQISWTKYSAVTFAFACVLSRSRCASHVELTRCTLRTTTPDSSQIALDTQSAALLPQFVSAAHDNVRTFSTDFQGGELTWTIFRVLMLYFRSAAGRDLFTTRPQVATADNRTAFVKAVVGLVTQYGLDGIDFE